MKLTKRIVEAVQANEDRLIVWDAEVKGFGLLVLPSGVKSYIFRYRSPEGRERRLTIGQHGAMTCEQARKIAAEHKHTVVHGGDPLARRQERRDAATVSDVIDAYLLSEEFKDKTIVTQRVDIGRIERHLRPLLGKKHADLVTEQDVRRAFAAIRDGKTAADVKTGSRGRARVRGGPGAARMAIVLLSVIFNWAIRDQRMKENPCRHFKLPAGGTREAILENVDDYARLFKTIDRMEEELRIRQPAADAIRLIALTGCRRGEAAGLRWRHVERDRIVLPPREHKAGRRTGKPRVIALPAVAQAIIARQPEGGPDDFVFTPAKGQGAIELTHVWDKIRTVAKLPADVTLHGLRHSVGSHLAMRGAETAQIMAALGHHQLSTAERYIHFAKSARSTLGEEAAAVAIAGMQAAGKPAKVVKLKGGRK
jgi:integrase